MVRLLENFMSIAEEVDLRIFSQLSGAKSFKDWKSFGAPNQRRVEPRSCARGLDWRRSEFGHQKGCAHNVC